MSPKKALNINMNNTVKWIYLELLKPSPQVCGCNLSNVNSFIKHGLNCQWRTTIDIDVTRFFEKYKKIRKT